MKKRFLKSKMVSFNFLTIFCFLNIFIFKCGEMEQSKIKLNDSGQLFRSTGFDVKLATPKQIEDWGFKFGDLRFLFEEEKDYHEDNVKFYLGQHYTIDTGKYLPWIFKNLKKLQHK